MREGNINIKALKEALHINLKIGEALRNARLDRGLSRQDLSQKIGVTHQQLGKYELGINRVSMSKAVQLARYLDISSLLEELFNSELSRLNPNSYIKKRMSLDVMAEKLNRKQQLAIRAIIESLI